MAVVMRVMGWANGTPMKALAGHYVCTVDVQQADTSIDWLTLTPHLAKARRWEDAGQAFATWTEILKSNPARLDGEPNRPFCAITVAIEQVTERSKT